MKKLLAKAASFLLAASVFLSGVPAYASGNTSAAVFSRTAYSNAAISSGETRMIITSAGIPVYTGPAVSYEHLLTLGYGDQLTVTAVTYDSGWTKISCGGYSEGWVSTDLLASSTTLITAPQEFAYSGKQAQVLTNALTVYTAPSASYSNILAGTGPFAGSLYRGQVVDALGYTTNGFTKIQYNLNGTILTGYVRSIWLKVTTKPANTPKETFKKIYGYSAQIKTEYEAVTIYASPYTDSAMLASLYSGQVVTILSESKNWYRITLNVNDEMLTGYIHRSFADRINALSNLSLNKTGKNLKRRQKYQLTLRGTTGMNVKVSWKSSKKSVATVSKRGYVTARKKGTAKITCTVKVGTRTRKLTCKIQVKK